MSDYDDSKDYSNDGFMNTFGRYEILFASAFPEDPEEDDSYDKGMQYMNGALCDPNRHYKYKIRWKVIGKEIDSIDFRIPDDNDKLSSVFGNLPYGLIKKNRTGIGATTLELNSKRKSIVVVPTRTLAYEKAKNSWSEDLQKYTIMYVGGSITGFNPQSFFYITWVMNSSFYI